MPETIALDRSADVVRVCMNRPEVRNALDARMIAELTDAFAEIREDAHVRAVVLEGAGKTFSGGADINYMRHSLELTREENYQDALRLSDMFAAIDQCPAPVVARVQTAALGGGAGLIAACDIVIAADDALFGFTEAKLGIVPAVISPFVLRKIGAGNARALFTTGERFGAARAVQIGLVHVAVPVAALDDAVNAIITEILACGPQATRTAKTIARTVPAMGASEAREWTAKMIAERRSSDEGQEGLRAFLEKRPPSWR